MRNLTLCLAAILIVLSGCQTNHKTESESEAVIPVTLTTIERKSISPFIRGMGILAASEESKLSFKIGGIIDVINVNEGQIVKKGEVLASLKLDEIQAMFTQAKSGLEKAERDYQRAENLYRDSVATLEQLQDAQTGLQIAQSQFKIAQFNLECAKITAPEDGKILKKLAEPNEAIAPGYPAFLFASGGKAWLVKVGLTDRDVVRCTLGDPADIQFDTYPGKTFAASIHEIAGAPEPMSGLYEVQLKLNHPSSSLMTGFVGRVTLHPSDELYVSLIPISALVNGHDDSGSVFTIKDSTAVQIPVSIAFLMDDSVALADPLETVGCVVSRGASYLKPGVKVRIINE